LRNCSRNADRFAYLSFARDDKLVDLSKERLARDTLPLLTAHARGGPARLDRTWPRDRPAAARLLERLLDILDQVVDMLDADRQAHEVRRA